MRRGLVLLIASWLVLLGCNESPPSSSLDEVEVSGRKGEAPTVRTGEGFEVDAAASKVLVEGDGQLVHEGDLVTFNYVGVNGRTGRQFDTSFEGGTPSTGALEPSSMIPGLVRALDDKRVGNRTLVALPPEDGYGKRGNPQAGIEGDDTLVFVVDIVAKPSSRASGEKQQLPDDLPRLVVDDQGRPKSFRPTKSTPKKVDRMRVETAIRGDGPAVRADQRLTVQFVSQVYPGGSVFERPRDRAPTSFEVSGGGIFPCWNKGLVGKPVGSRVILVCPPSQGRGQQDTDRDGVRATDTLIFAIDILVAQDAPSR